MASINIDNLTKGLLDYFVTEEMEKLIAKLTMPGLLAKISIGVAIAVEAIAAVERLAYDLETLDKVEGREKRAAVVAAIDEAVELQFYLEPLDGFVIKIAIDGIVGYYNARFGHKWLDEVKGVLFG